MDNYYGDDDDDDDDNDDDTDDDDDDNHGVNDDTDDADDINDVGEKKNIQASLQRDGEGQWPMADGQSLIADN